MEFSNTSGIRSPFSPRVRQSISGRRQGVSSAKKNQSKFMQSAEAPTGDVIYKTPMTTVETYGHPLPVLVTEALTFASGEVSVRLSACGYCWLVSGRRALVWERTAGAAARELTLPQTDLQHRADLLEVFYEDGAQMASCIAVSPEGVVRYWPSVGQELHVDTHCELSGQECARLQRCTDRLLLATTSCSVLLLHTENKQGRPAVSYHTLRPPSGWLGGLGRRVSVLFFGSMPANTDTKLVGVAVLVDGPMGAECAGGEGAEGAEPGYIALVGGAGGGALQLWRGAELHEHDLRRLLLDAHRAQGDASGLQVSVVDVRARGGTELLLLLLLAAPHAATHATHAPRAPDMRYAIAHVCVADPTAPRVTSLAGVRGAASDAQPARFLPLSAPPAHPAPATLLYAPAYLALLSGAAPNDKVEYIDVSAEGDRILAAELCGAQPLLFSAKHGVMALKHADAGADTSICESPMGSPCPSEMYDGNLSLYEIDPHEVSAVSTDACGKLKAAFLFHVRREPAAARALLEELFPARRRDKAPDAALDRTVHAVAAEIVDDVPQGDPRWKTRGGGGGGATATCVPLGSSSALQVAAQLRDKQRALALFTEFLRAAGLHARLGTVRTESGECVSTAAALGQLAEQLAAARALRARQQAAPGDAQLLDAAVYQVVCGPDAQYLDEEPSTLAALSSGTLSPADVCFRRASRIWRLLATLATLTHQGDPRTQPAMATRTADIITGVFSEVHKCRAQWQGGAPPPSPPPPPPRDLLPALVDLHTRAVSQYAPACGDVSARSQLLEACGALADVILTEAPPRSRPAIARDVIRPYVEVGQTERAAVLAEKFKDYELLVEMCVKENDMDRLYGYIDKYPTQGVAELAFERLAREGAGAARLLRGATRRCPAALRAWLQHAQHAQHAPQHAQHDQHDQQERRAWLQALQALRALQARELREAAAVLADMADAETDSAGRMTTAASLAKLCAMCGEAEEAGAGGEEVRRRAEARLALGEQLEALPRDLQLQHALQPPDCRVVPVEDLVQMYINSESSTLTEYDYKKALDLTDFIADMEVRDDLRLRVWCACIRRAAHAAAEAQEARECGGGVGAELGVEDLAGNMFYRLMQLVHDMGGDLELVLPPCEDLLTAPELAELVSDPRLHYAVKYAHERRHAHTHTDMHTDMHADTHTPHAHADDDTAMEA